MREIVDGIADVLGKRPLPLRIPGSLAGIGLKPEPVPTSKPEAGWYSPDG